MPNDDKSVDKVVQTVQDQIPRKWRNLGLEGVDIIFGRRKNTSMRSSFDLTGAVADKLRPKAYVEFDCDWCPRERWANVITSAPYAMVGADLLRSADKKPLKLFAWSQIAVGGVAAFYHATRGRWRTLGRRADFWTIAAGSAAMTRAAYPGCSPAWTALSLAATPFAPFAASTVNTCALELKFLRRAQSHRHLRQPLFAHAAAAGIGLGLFALDEVKPHEIGCVHAIWHLMSCAAVHKTAPFLLDEEKRNLGGGGGAGAASGAWQSSETISPSSLRY